MSVSQVSGGDSPLVRAGTAEREATKRINDAAKQVDEAQKQSAKNLNQIQDHYEQEAMARNARYEGALQEQQVKGYEHIRDLRKGQDAESRRIRKDGEKDLSHLKEHYRNEVDSISKDNHRQVSELQNQNQRRIEYEKQMNDFEVEDVRTQHENQVRRLKDHHEEEINKVNTDSRTVYDKLKAEYEESNTRAKEHFDSYTKRVIDESQKTLDRIEGQVSHRIQDIRKDTSDKLAAYQSRQSDPFYKLMALQGKVYETGDSFILTARVPAHEQKGMTATIKGDNLIISGYRRNEETLETSPGHQLNSSSFQSFNESFPLSWPVEKNRLTKEFQGDLLIVRVPKKNEYAFKKPQHAKPEKVRVEHPHFPSNLPLASSQEAKTENKSDSQSPDKGRGSGTLA
jgi:HSP20 family molecular chaperone IbpA